MHSFFVGRQSHDIFMTRRNKNILWSVVGVTVATLIALYLFVPAVHNWVNDLIGNNEKMYPTPGSSDNVEYEYGIPVENLETEKLDIPRDSILDSLIHADSTFTAGVVKPVEGPQPTHVEGFGEGPLPPKPTDENMPIKKDEQNPDQALTPEQIEQMEQATTPVGDAIELELHTSTNLDVNNKMIECRNAYNVLYKVYNEYKSTPTPKLKAEGIKQKENLIESLTQLMDIANKNNDIEGQEESGQLRREVNKMVF